MKDKNSIEIISVNNDLIIAEDSRFPEPININDINFNKEPANINNDIINDRKKIYELSYDYNQANNQSWKDDLKKSTAMSYDELGRKYYEQEQYFTAIPLIEKAHNIAQNLFEIPKQQLSIINRSLGLAYKKTGSYEAAKCYLYRALDLNDYYDEIMKSTIISELASIDFAVSNYHDAEEELLQVVKIKEKKLGLSDLSTAEAYSNLAIFYEDTNRFKEAEEFIKKAINIHESKYGKIHMDDSSCYMVYGDILRNMQRYDEADSLYKRAFELNNKIKNNDLSFLSSYYASVADLYNDMGDYNKAIATVNKAIKISENAFGKYNLNTNYYYNNRASYYINMGEYSEAERLLQQSTEIKQSLLGEYNPGLLTNYNNLITIYRQLNQNDEAIALARKVIKINQDTYGDDSVQTASAYLLLAIIYINSDHKHDDEVKTLADNAVKILETKSDTYDATSAGVNFTLGNVFYEMNKLKDAEKFYKKSIEISKSLVNDDANIITYYIHLAFLYLRTGNVQEESQLFQKISNLMKNKDAYAPKYDLYTNNSFALLCALHKDYELSDFYFDKAMTIFERERESLFTMMSERQKLDYMARFSSVIYGEMSLTAQFNANNKQAVKDSFNHWIAWKGAVLESQGRYQEAAHFSNDPAVKAKIDEYNKTKRELANVIISKSLNLIEREARIKELTAKTTDLESSLSRVSTPFALEKRIGKADIKSISDILLKIKEKNVYIDYANIKDIDFNETRIGHGRYLAFVLIPGNDPEIHLLDIGASDAVDTKINEYLKAINKATSGGGESDRELNNISKALYSILIKPLEPYIKDKNRLYISPDGNINLLPFDALQNQDDEFLLNKYLISYISGGRDIIRFDDKSKSSKSAVLVYNPDYDMTGKTNSSLSSAVTRDASGLYFSPLPGTETEANGIKSVLSGHGYKYSSYSFNTAIEQNMYGFSPPGIIHIATHGYFLKKQEGKDKGQLGQFDTTNYVSGIENPMLRSGLALAGVNSSLKSGKSDGLLSADKVLGMNLYGTDLVVLSACDTGVGDVENGEGVFGLKRAFILSGAKSVVFSNWKVSDKVTSEFMNLFYSNMLSGKVSKAEALHNAQDTIRNRYRSPYYWAAFSLTGNPE